MGMKMDERTIVYCSLTCKCLLNKFKLRNYMTEINRLKYLKMALFAVGAIFAFGIYPLTIFLPSGWSWHSGQSEYLQMILGIYFTLGVFLMRAARNPLAHRSLIWFTVWSSFVHALIMSIQSIVIPNQMGHLLGDVPALFIVALLLACLIPQKKLLP